MFPCSSYGVKVTTEKTFDTILSGYLSAIFGKNARQYIQYYLRFLPLLTKTYLADYSITLLSVVTGGSSQ